MSTIPQQIASPEHTNSMLAAFSQQQEQIRALQNQLRVNESVHNLARYRLVQKFNNLRLKRSLFKKWSKFPSKTKKWRKIEIYIKNLNLVRRFHTKRMLIRPILLHELLGAWEIKIDLASIILLFDPFKKILLSIVSILVKPLKQ